MALPRGDAYGALLRDSSRTRLMAPPINASAPAARITSWIENAVMWASQVFEMIGIGALNG